MIKEGWDSFKDNIKERVSNPFLGTFALVWVVHNWQVVYAFFYFDSDYKLSSRIGYFKRYWSDNNFIWNLICVAAITIVVLVITYFFLAISRLFANYFENIIVPKISEWTKGNIYTEEQYEDLIEKIKKSETKFEVERKLKNEAILEREEIEKKLFVSESKHLENANDHSQKSITDSYKLINEIKSKFNPELIEKILLEIGKRMRVDANNEIGDFLLKKGLIVSNSISGLRIEYSFTEKGNEFRDLYFKK